MATCLPPCDQQTYLTLKAWDTEIDRSNESSEARIRALNPSGPSFVALRCFASTALLWLAGGASQLETFDPKPGRPTGGPFRAIPTAEPGIDVCELLPKIAQRIKHTAIIRS